MSESGNWKIIRGTRFVFLLVALCALAAPLLLATASEKDLIDHPACLYCGMDRHKFAHSRVLITYNDGSTAGTCSVHCAAVDLSLKIDKTPLSIMVADYNTKRLIDAESARWVIGGSKMGVMTRRAKWAFATGEDAQAFTTAHGGSPGEFPGAIRAAYEDMYDDLRMIRAKRQKMRKNKGS